jgi:hypothetical protein
VEGHCWPAFAASDQSIKKYNRKLRSDLVFSFRKNMRILYSILHAAMVGLRLPPGGSLERPHGVVLLKTLHPQAVRCILVYASSIKLKEDVRSPFACKDVVCCWVVPGVRILPSIHFNIVAPACLILTCCPSRMGAYPASVNRG